MKRACHILPSTSISLLFAVLTLIMHVADAQQPFDPALIKRLDSITTDLRRTARIPGLVIAVLANNKVVYKRTAGVESTATGKKISAHSDFHTASVSKPFVATAILRLSEQGKLNIDSALSQYLPYFVMKDPRYKKITLRHILTHSSGIPDFADYGADHPQLDDQSAERYARSFADSTLDFEPGTQFKYSNAAFDILAAVISRVSGMPFETYLRKQNQMTINMRSSSFLLADIAMKNRTVPHRLDGQSNMSPLALYPYNRIHAPSSTLHSNLDDMLQWARLYLGKGTYNKKSIITEKTWELMLQPQRALAEDYYVCLSWFATSVEGKRIYFHSGGDTGYQAFMGFCPWANIAVVLMGNNDNFDGAETGFTYFRALLRQ